MARFDGTPLAMGWVGPAARRLGARALALGALAASAPAAAQPSVMELMDAMVVPQSDALFAIGRAAPAAPAEWEALRLDAIVLMEAGRALTLPERSQGADWDGWSRGMAAAAARAVAAIDARDVDAALAAGNGLIETCTGCHRRHLPR